LQDNRGFGVQRAAWMRSGFEQQDFEPALKLYTLAPDVDVLDDSERVHHAPSFAFNSRR
jgi:hypothetical protein